MPDERSAKRVVMVLAVDPGFAPDNVGALAVSRHLAALAVAWIRLACTQKKGTGFGFALPGR